MSAAVIPFPWQAPKPAERRAKPALVLILPVIRIERYNTHVPREAPLQGDVARELEMYAEDR